MNFRRSRQLSSAVALPSALLWLLQGCSYQIPAYSVDTFRQRGERNAVYRPVIRVEPSAFEDRGQLACRALFDLTVGEGRSFRDYFAEAIEAQLDSYRYHAGLPGKPVTATLLNLGFSTRSGYAVWHVDASYQIGVRSLRLTTDTRDIASFLSDSACERTASLFETAISEHLDALEEHAVYRSEMGLMP